MEKPKIFQDFGSWLLLGLFVLVGYWLLFDRVLPFLEDVNPSVAVAAVGIGVAFYTQAQIRRREIEEAHRSKKVEIYQEFLEIVVRLLTQDNPNVSLKPLTEQELTDFLIKFKTAAILWSSPRVINAQLKFEKSSVSDGDSLLAADELYMAIREDIGLSNRGLEKHQLAGLRHQN